MSKLYEINTLQVAEIKGIKIKKGQAIKALVTCKGSKRVGYAKHKNLQLCNAKKIR